MGEKISEGGKPLGACVGIEHHLHDAQKRIIFDDDDRKAGCRLSVNVAAKIAESSIASAAAIHLACAVPNVDWGVSLTHFYLAEDIVRRPPALVDGLVSLPTTTGLGVDVDESAVARFRKY